MVAFPALLFSFHAPPNAPQTGNPAAGQALFSGARTFQKGGPPCGACHTIGALGFPNGGTMGPDLTRAYPKLGEQGMDAMLDTLYFPAMIPLFDNRPLTSDEQRDLKAFFMQASASGPPEHLTAILSLIAFGGFLVLLVLSWVLWRSRLRAVRASLIESAGGEPRS